jgi:hypothetical protein
MRPSLLACIGTIAATLAVSGAEAATDAAKGHKLYGQYCTGCHIRLVGGDGSAIHTRQDRMIHSLSALQQRVAFCSTQINAHLFPDEEADISAWLNDTFYKFK